MDKDINNTDFNGDTPDNESLYDGNDKFDEDDVIDEDYEEEVSDDNISDKDKLSKNNHFRNLKKDLSSRFVKISCLIYAAVLFAAFTFGYVTPGSDSAISKRLDSMHTKNKLYVQTKKNYDEALEKKKDASEQLGHKQRDLDKLTQSQDGLRKLSESNSALEEEKNTLREEVEKKQSELETLNLSVAEKTKKTVTWSSGRYSVGENIASGNYTVTGSGSISIGNSGKSIINKALNSSGDNIALNNGDVIQIDGTAKFVPE
ncbi:MAG: hypothetical protein J1F01_01795 [Oscillospiraceae bacterium]|nr:hypothetical protein [Oscillospiraceae bacterium]